MAKSTNKDYRALKKWLNQNHHFSFKMPRKGKDFSPQQKSAITRKFNELKTLITSTRNEKASFIKFPKGSKLPGVDGKRTNKGIFLPTAGATLQKIKKRGKRAYLVKIKFGNRRSFFLSFPEEIHNNLERIKKWVNKYAKILKPDNILWSVYGHRATVPYMPDDFNQYIDELKQDRHMKKDMRNEARQGRHLFNGVFFEYRPGTVIRVPKDIWQELMK